jgi:hypothetical protein
VWPAPLRGILAAVLAAAVVLAGAALLSFAHFTVRGRHHVIHGFFTIGPSVPLYWRTPTCIYNGNSYLNKGQIHTGTPVTVTDTNGKIIAIGAVLGGVTTGAGRTCTFSYDVTVPDRSGYVIQLSNWDPFVVSRSELDANHWRSGSMPGP